MSQLICVMTKPDSATTWIISPAPYAEAVCTADQMNNTVIPARNYETTLAGYQSQTVTVDSDTQLTITTTFDTVDNATAALDAIYHPDPTNNPLTYARKQLMKELRTANNVINNGIISVQ